MISVNVVVLQDLVLSDCRHIEQGTLEVVLDVLSVAADEAAFVIVPVRAEDGDAATAIFGDCDTLRNQLAKAFVILIIGLPCKSERLLYATCPFGCRKFRPCSWPLLKPARPFFFRPLIVIWRCSRGLSGRIPSRHFRRRQICSCAMACHLLELAWSVLLRVAHSGVQKQSCVQLIGI